MNRLRARFWVELALVALTTVLFLLTLVSREWIEVLFGVDPADLVRTHVREEEAMDERGDSAVTNLERYGRLAPFSDFSAPLPRLAEPASYGLDATYVRRDRASTAGDGGWR